MINYIVDGLRTDMGDDITITASRVRLTVSVDNDDADIHRKHVLPFRNLTLDQVEDLRDIAEKIKQVCEMVSANPREYRSTPAQRVDPEDPVDTPDEVLAQFR